jgi:hypothetical protein
MLLADCCLHDALQELTTDGSGTATGSVQLSELPSVNATNPGDSLQLEASWVGPTRERITAAASVR